VPRKPASEGRRPAPLGFAVGEMSDSIAATHKSKAKEERKQS